jgi:hypothetical protein
MQHAERLVSAPHSKDNQVCTHATCVFVGRQFEKKQILIREIDGRLASALHGESPTILHNETKDRMTDMRDYDHRREERPERNRGDETCGFSGAGAKAALNEPTPRLPLTHLIGAVRKVQCRQVSHVQVIFQRQR